MTSAKKLPPSKVQKDAFAVPFREITPHKNTATMDGAKIENIWLINSKMVPRFWRKGDQDTARIKTITLVTFPIRIFA